MRPLRFAVTLAAFTTLIAAQAHATPLTPQQQNQFATTTYNNCLSDFLKSPYKARVKEFGVPYCTCVADTTTGSVTLEDLYAVHKNKGTLPNYLIKRVKANGDACDKKLSSKPLSL